MIKDSGERREFETGAVRDVQEGKGRCDLLPLDVIAYEFESEEVSRVLIDIYNFTVSNDWQHLLFAFNVFAEENYSSKCEAILELSKHFEEGAKKYGEYNWQKGIPTHCYIDSAVRHLLKYIRGDQDEPHDRAFMWNLVCCIWTCKHKPELNDYAKEKEQ